MEKEKKERSLEKNDSYYLPREMWEQVLLKLPYRSLSRFKCVSKFWYSLFTRPPFIPPHLSDFIKHHSYNNSVVLRFTFPQTARFIGPELSVMDNLKLCFLSSKDSSAVDSSSPSFDMFGSRRFQISGHCNGILCLSVGYRTKTKIVLYNPATRQFKCLPNSVMQDHSSFTISVGMGYDSRIDDYKVVRINSMGIAYGVEEYSLSTDSWTPLCKSNASDFRFGRFALFFRGTYYWWASRRWEYSSTTMILGLNMGDEVFRTVSVPREVACSKSGDRNKLLALWKNESICLIYSYGPERSPSLPMIDMWVMDGFGGDQVSWTKMHKITTNFPFLVGVQPLVFWKGNELLLETFFGEIKTYNVDTGEITSIKVEGPIVPGNTQAVNYVATLVSIKGGSFLPLT